MDYSRLVPSEVVGKRELSLFDSQPVQASITRQKFVVDGPDGAIVARAPITFTGGKRAYEYIDLAGTRVRARFRIKGNTKYALSKHVVGCANMPLSSLFQDIQLYIGGTQVEGSSNLYPYKAYMCALLDYGQVGQASVMMPWGFYKDEAGKMNDGANPGLLKRTAFLTPKAAGDWSEEWTVWGGLFLDMMRQQQRLLPNDTEVRLVFLPSSPDWFVLITNAADPTGDSVEPTKMQVEITELEVWWRLVMPAPGVLQAHMELGKRAKAMYPHQRIVMTTFTISKGDSSAKREKLFGGEQAPKLLVLGIVSDAAFTGTLRENPFNFVNPGLNYLACTLDNESVPGRPLQFNNQAEGALGGVEYGWLLQQLGLGQADRDIGFTLNDYINGGYCLFAFSLSGELGTGEAGVAQLYKQANLGVELQLKAAANKAYKVILMGVFDRRLDLSRERLVVPTNLF